MPDNYATFVVALDDDITGELKSARLDTIEELLGALHGVTVAEVHSEKMTEG